VRFAHITDTHIQALADQHTLDADQPVRPMALEGGAAA
jgi:hypothetical protein